MKPKEFDHLAQTTGLTHDKRRHLLYGPYKNQMVAVRGYNDVAKYTILCSAASSTDAAGRFDTDIAGFLSDNKWALVGSRDQNLFTVEIKTGASSAANEEHLLQALDTLTDDLNAHGYAPCCAKCANAATPAPCVINDKVSLLCASCYNDEVAAYSGEETAARSKHSNVLLGLVGAFVGSLIGVALWVLIYHLGYIAAIAGLAIAICALKGYQMLGGRLDAVGMAVSVAVIVVMVYIAHTLAYSLDVYMVFKDEYAITFFDAFQMLPELMQEPEIASPFLVELVIGYLLTAVGSVTACIRLYKESNKKFTAERLEA